MDSRISPPASAPVMEQKVESINPLMNYQSLIEMYNISPRYKEFLNKLYGYHVVIIADDSGSMTSRPNPQSPSRWEDLLGMIDLVVKGSAIFDPYGIDVHFLNRGYLSGITDSRQLAALRYPPTEMNLTPLVKTLDDEMKRSLLSDKKTLLIIATDGHPSDIVIGADGRTIPSQDAFMNLMKQREDNTILREKCAISFLMCTDEEEIVEFYDAMKDVKHYHHVEVTETYAQEYNEVINELHKSSFTPGDHVIKMLLGPIVPEIAQIDQPQSTKNTNGSSVSNNNNQDIIDISSLKQVVEQYNRHRANYGYFSNTPRTLDNLQRLYFNSTVKSVTKSDIRACIGDEKHYLDHPPVIRRKLTNREKLICDLADLFNKNPAPAMKMKR